MTSATSRSGAGVLDDLLCFDLYAASRAMTATYRGVLEPHGLTYPQYLVLVTLRRSGPSSIREIAATLRLDHGTLTPLLRRMEDRGLVLRERGATDGRSVLVSLAAGGEALRETLDEVQCHIEEAVGLGAIEMAELRSVLHRLTERLVPGVQAQD